jgi:ATP-dependent DNA helicase RecG
MNLLEQNITYLAGVGPRIADLLKRELNIHTVDDLLRHYPYKHIDRSRFYRINEINDEQTYVQIKGQSSGWKCKGKVGRQG